MRVFEICGKFQQQGRWSERESDFIGYFVMEEGSDAIRGYMEEQFDTPYDPIRYFKGFYMEGKKQLTFMKMCNAMALQPLAYVFHNREQEGLWSGFDFCNGFFPGGRSEGKATVRLEEVLDAEKKHELAQRTLEVYEEKVGNASDLNAALLEIVDELMDFLDENSRYYLKQP